MKDIDHFIASRSYTRIFFWLFMLSLASLIWEVGFCAENEAFPVNEPPKVISNEEAVDIAREYLNMGDTKNYKTKIEEKVITANAFNTYKILEPGINRMCWIVTLIVPDAVGASRTVYIDKKTGEILGGYSSK